MKKIFYNFKMIEAGSQGYSLVELMVVVLLMSIAAMFMYKIFLSYTINYDNVVQLVQLQQSQRLILEKMADDFRLAGYDPRGTTNAGIDPASTSSSATITMDLNGDGSISGNESISYSFDAATHRMWRNGDEFSDSVDLLEILYVDADNNTVVPGGGASKVEITLIIRTTDPDYGHRDTGVYKNLRGATIFTGDDHYHRRLLGAEVQCRNNSI